MSRVKTISMILVVLVFLGAATVGLRWLFGVGRSAALELPTTAQESTNPADAKTVSAHSLPNNVRRELGKSFTFIRGPELRPPGDPRVWIDSLKGAAERGDAEASYSIYLALMDCEMYLKASSPEELQQSKSLGVAPQYEQTVLRKLTECASLDASEMNQIGVWLTKAASQGSIEAQVAYATSPNRILGTEPDEKSEQFREWQGNAIAYLHEATLKGSIDALANLSNSYMAGVITLRDPIRAYASQLALNEINPNFSSEYYRREIAKELSPAQIHKAQELSKKFFTDVTKDAGALQ